MGILDLLGESRGTILQGLLGQELTAKHLAAELNMSETAVRSQLETLESQGFVRSRFERSGGRGRPRKLYTLTPAGQEAFPRRYEVLLSALIDTMLESEGSERTSEMVANAGRRLALKWRPRFAPGTAPMLKAHMIVRRLNEMGFAASLRFEGDRPVIVRHNCIFHRAASSHRDLVCERFDDALLRTMLEGLDVRLSECIPDGKGACKTIIMMDGPAHRET